MISDKELGEIKHMPKQISKSEAESLEEEINETDYDDEPEVKITQKEDHQIKKRKQKKRWWSWTDYCDADYWEL